MSTDPVMQEQIKKLEEKVGVLTDVAEKNTMVLLQHLTGHALEADRHTHPEPTQDIQDERACQADTALRHGVDPKTLHMGGMEPIQVDDICGQCGSFLDDDGICRDNPECGSHWPSGQPRVAKNGRPILTEEDTKKMDCPHPPEPTGYTTSKEIVEAIMRTHWNSGPCDCWICSNGHAAGMRPRHNRLSYEAFPAEPTAFTVNQNPTPQDYYIVCQKHMQGVKGKGCPICEIEDLKEQVALFRAEDERMARAEDEVGAQINDMLEKKDQEMTALKATVAELEQKQCDLYTMNGLPCKHMSESLGQSIEIEELKEALADSYPTALVNILVGGCDAKTLAIWDEERLKLARSKE